MTRTKSLRYNAASDEPLLIQSGKDFFENCKGKRRSDYFKNNNPIVLELACGRGEYTVGLSQIYPDKNFIGVDVKGERMMMGIKKWKEQTSPQPDLTPTPLLAERGYSTIGKGGYLHILAKQNRKDMTTSEEYLWFLLRNRQIEGLKFRRQHPIKGYIADFYCAEYKLIIEVDGGYHTTLPQQEYDTMRDEILIKNGYTILRFTNDEINNNIDEVLQKIIKSCGHSSLSGEGTGVRLAFLRTIIHHIDQFFAPGEVDEIWIVHPDPRPKGHDARRRITSPRFLKMYDSILKPGGLLKLKTDDDGLFEYSMEEIERWRDGEKVGTFSGNVGDEYRDFGSGPEGHGFELIDTTWDLDQSPLLADHHGIETHYGKIFVAEGRTIKYGVWEKRG